MVDAYIALTEFSRQKFIQGGLPAEKITVKSNFVHPDPGIGEDRREYALFAGRLSPEKGVYTLLSAWQRLKGKPLLKIVGDGPLSSRVAEVARRTPRIECLGRRPVREVYELMGKAAFLVFPSELYETFGLVVAESFAKGTPVIASKIGAIAELVDHGRTGLHFRPSDPEDLAAQINWVLEHPSELDRMSREARAEFETKFTAERNYQALMRIYQTAAS
jgi:glycosyltransferase involved in cell wall biosynthesis